MIDIETGGSSPTAFLSWFTYADGHQQWLVGSGPIEIGTGEVNDLPLIVTEGGQFGPGFDPAQVTFQDWGTISLRFEDCDNAVLEYAGQFPGGTEQSGSIELVRFNGASLGQPCQAVDR